MFRYLLFIEWRYNFLDLTCKELSMVNIVYNQTESNTMCVIKCILVANEKKRVKLQNYDLAI